MNKIRIIDLLNKIANGEEVPEKIKVFGEEFNYDGYDYYSIHSSSPLMSYVGEDYLRAEMNYDIEIIEEPQEHKIPEKIQLTNGGLTLHDNNNDYTLSVIHKCLINKINEILDYLEVNNGIMD